MNENKPFVMDDDRLRLIFRCCHPALDRGEQVALTLYAIGGLTVEEIARAFLSSTATLTEHLATAENKCRAANVTLQAPSKPETKERLPSVQAVIYLIFNEGYVATTSDQLVRHDLCAEAIRLGRGVCKVFPHDAETLALLALMLLQDSRHLARSLDGALVTLEDQDRSLWDRDQIREGRGLVDLALHHGPVGPYQLQACIAALHAEAETPQATDWRQIAALYGKLFEFDPSPVVALNRAVAIAMSDGYAEGLNLIDAIGATDALDSYHLFHAARADILRRMNRPNEAADSYRRAIELTKNGSERGFLTRRLKEVALKLRDS